MTASYSFIHEELLFYKSARFYTVKLIFDIYEKIIELSYVFELNITCLTFIHVIFS